MTPKRPDFLIVGSAKSGTTALASILDAHPDCCMSRPKEANFFQDTIDYEINPNIALGWDWYQTHFRHYNGETLIGEGTPSYSDRSRSPDTAKRIREFNPDMKIIYMVRDPLERQISAWKMHHAMFQGGVCTWRREHQWAMKGFDTWMKRQKDAGQWEECRYFFQLSAYRDQFSDSQIHLILMDDWKIRKAAEILKVMDFLGLASKGAEASNDEFSNRGDGRKFVRPGWNQLRKQPWVRPVIKLLPSPIRSKLQARLLFTTPVVPPADLNKATRAEFLNFLRDDVSLLFSHLKRTDIKWTLD